MDMDPATLPAGPARFEALRKAGRLARGQWEDTDSQGRLMLGWLVALSDEVLEEGDPDACPASIAPKWLAHVIAEMEEHVSETRWAELAQRLGQVAWHLPSLSVERGHSVREAWLVFVLEVALETVSEDHWGVRDAVTAVQRLLQRGGSEEEWMTASADAFAAAGGAWSADAGLTAKAATRAGWAASLGWLGPGAAARAAGSAWSGWDRIADHLLGLLEAEVEGRPKPSSG